LEEVTQCGNLVQGGAESVFDLSFVIEIFMNFAAEIPGEK